MINTVNGRLDTELRESTKQKVRLCYRCKKSSVASRPNRFISYWLELYATF